jgi:hypothetical protein
MPVRPHPGTRTLRVFSVLCFAAALAVAPLARAEPVSVKRADFPPATGPATTQIGVNLEGVADFSRSMMFADAMKSARKFGSVKEPWDEKADVDDKGWPTTDAGVVVMADIPVKPGDYAFSCTGRCQVGLASKGSVKNQAYNRSTNTTTATVTIPDGVNDLFLTFKNTNGGVKNIKLMRPGFSASSKEHFTKEFLALLAPFSTLRTMDLTLTNNSPIAEWSERATPDDATQGMGNGKGVAWEYVIELANQTRKDLWINVPDKASDDYVRQLARLFKEKLDKDRNLYVEYSNEVWNSIFKQTGRNHEAAKAEIAAGDTTLTDGGKDQNEYYWGWKRVSKRTVQIARIFREVFGEEAMNTRVRPVLASQSANPFMTRLQLEYIAKYHGEPAKYIYGIAGAPYFGPDRKISDKDDASVEELINSIKADPGYMKVMAAYAVLARYYRVHHLCYEGGLGIEGEKNLANKIKVNRDPRIAGALTDYLNTWYGTGGELFMYYNLTSMYTKWGCWGLTDTISVPPARQTPKYKAVAAFEKAPMPPLAVRVTAPGQILAWQFDINEGGGIENSRDGGKNLCYLGDGSTFYYLLNVQEPGDYKLTFQTAATAPGGKLAIDLSGTTVGEVETPVTGDTQAWKSTAPLDVKLEKGQLVLRMRVAKSGMNIRSITFEKAAS